MTPEVFAEKLKAIDAKLDRLIDAIEGNGQPGLKIRVDRIEQRWKAGAAIAGTLFLLVAEAVSRWL